MTLTQIFAAGIVLVSTTALTTTTYAATNSANTTGNVSF